LGAKDKPAAFTLAGGRIGEVRGKSRRAAETNIATSLEEKVKLFLLPINGREPLCTIIRGKCAFRISVASRMERKW
jgi:hypothetical protein